MGTVVSLILYVLLLIGGILIARTTKWRNLSIALIGVASGLAILSAIGLLPAPAYNDLLPAAPLFGIWLISGVLLGGALFLLRTGRLLLAAGSIAALVVLLVLLGWPLELSNPNLGWGLFALPAIVAGVLLTLTLTSGRRDQAIYVLGWLIVVGMVALPHYLMVMDTNELGQSYLSNNPTPYVQAEVLLTVVYLVGSLALLMLPLALSYFKLQRSNHSATST